MKNKDKEYADALEWFNELLADIVNAMLESGKTDISNDELDFIKTIREALTRPQIDWEALKVNFEHHKDGSSYDEEADRDYCYIRNQALDDIKKLIEEKT